MAVGWSIDTGHYVQNGRSPARPTALDLSTGEVPKPDRLNQQSCFTFRRRSVLELTPAEQAFFLVARGFWGAGGKIRTLFVTAW
jgi:hypothetical protein